MQGYMLSLFSCYFTGKKRGASFKISGVSINAASVLKHEEELDPLALCIPTDAIQRKQ